MNDLWPFALVYYGQPGAPKTCLALQDQYGVDIVLTLYLLHLATARRVLDGGELARIDSAIAPWRESVIIPLRTLRSADRVKPGYPEWPVLRQSLKQAELEAERQQIGFLQSLPARTTIAETVLGAARNNLSLYCGLIAAPPGSLMRLLAFSPFARE